MTPFLKVLLLYFGLATADELLPLHGGKDRACKGIRSGTPGQVQKWSAHDLNECKRICTGKCQAVQWVPSSHLCELWNVPVVHSMSQQGAECYAKKTDATKMSDALMPKDTTCLSMTSACSSADARVGCLMNKDSAGPCVWCGGAACNDQSQAVCESFGSWKAGGSMAVVRSGAGVGDTEVAQCEAGKPAVVKVKHESWQATAPSPKELELLTPADGGCSSLTSKEDCLSSKDASVATKKHFKVSGEACVWCGGIACTSEDDAKCGPFDYVMHGEGIAFDLFHAKHMYEVAGRSSSVKRADWKGDCLEKASQGCPSLKDEYSCLASVDGRSEDPYHKGLKVAGEPCVWCNGAVCHNNGTNRCEVYDVQVHGKGKVFNHSLSTGITVAQCDGPVVKQHLPAFLVSAPPFPITRPSPMEIACLKAEPKGCQALKNRFDCLSSVDGSEVASFGGIKIKGEPCVWCGGGHCHTGNHSLCAPFDYLEKGAGRAFETLNAVALTPAKCSLDSTNFGDLSCLEEAASGCNAIDDEDTCLARVDGRAYEQVAGYKVKGQPCVWCGGMPCRDGGLNKCEPYDFAVNGEGHVYERARNVPFDRAGCSDGKALGLPVLPSKAGKKAHAHHDWFPASRGDTSCLETMKCSDVKDKLICLSSKDSELGLMKDSLHKGGDACVWCGGEPCTSGSDALCEAFDFLHRGEGHAFDDILAEGNHKVAQCWHTPDHELDTECLTEKPEGCNRLDDPKQCLSSFDGRPYERVAGFRVKGQPCVWCGGEACTANNDNKCEPLDFVLNGGGYAFHPLGVPSTRSMAGCKSGHPLSLPLPAKTNVINLKQAAEQGGQSDEMTTAASGIHMVSNFGKDCWSECGQKSGFCNYCGGGNACCRHDETEGPKECQGPIHFYTWHHECIAPVKQTAGSAAAAAAAATGAAGVAATVASQSLVNIGKDCWWECGQKSGMCPFCGNGNACCRKDYGEYAPRECKGSLTFTTWHHECVVPIHSTSSQLFQKLAAVGADASSLAAKKGMSPEEQVKQAALAIGRAAKAEGLSPQSAAQIAAAGAQEAAKKNQQSQEKQQQLAVMAAALAATEATKDDMSPQERAAEVGLAVAESASAAGMSLEEQMEAAASAIGTYASQAPLSPQEAAKVAAAGAQRAAHADGKAPEEGSALAATAAGIAAAKAGKGSGAGGVQLASLIATSALAASAGLAPEEKLKSVQEALRRTAEDTGLGAEALEKLAKQTVPAAAAGNTAGSAATSSSDHSKGSPYKQAEQAGRAAFDQAAAEHLSSEEQIAAAHKASKDAATAAGMSPEEAEKIADAMANAVSGGATEEMDPDLVVTIAPSATGKVVAGNNNGYPPLEETPAQRDAAEAGAAAARLSKADGQLAQRQLEAAAVAAGRAATNGGMDPVGAEEASRKAATLAGIKAGLSAAEAARLGTEAAEKAATSGAFTAQNWMTDKVPTTTTASTTTTTEEVMIGPIKARGSAKDATAVAKDTNATSVTDFHAHDHEHHDHTLLWVLLGVAVAMAVAAFIRCTQSMKGSKRVARSGDVEVPDDEESSEELLEMAPPSPVTSIPKKGPRVPLPSRSERSRAQPEAVPLLPEAPAPAPAPPAPATHSRLSSAAVSVSSMSAAPVAVPARTNLAPALTPVPAYTYRPQTYVTSTPVTMPPVTVAAPIVTSPVTVTTGPVMPAASVASQPMARAQALFDVLDANHDGVLDANEFAQLRTLDGRRAQPPMPPMEPVTVAPVRTAEFGSVQTYSHGM